MSNGNEGHPKQEKQKLLQQNRVAVDIMAVRTALEFLMSQDVEETSYEQLHRNEAIRELRRALNEARHG